MAASSKTPALGLQTAPSSLCVPLSDGFGNILLPPGFKWICRHLWIKQTEKAACVTLAMVEQLTESAVESFVLRLLDVTAPFTPN